MCIENMPHVGSYESMCHMLAMDYHVVPSSFKSNIIHSVHRTGPLGPGVMQRDDKGSENMGKDGALLLTLPASHYGVVLQQDTNPL